MSRKMSVFGVVAVFSLFVIIQLSYAQGMLGAAPRKPVADNKASAAPDKKTTAAKPAAKTTAKTAAKPVAKSTGKTPPKPAVRIARKTAKAAPKPVDPKAGGSTTTTQPAGGHTTTTQPSDTGSLTANQTAPTAIDGVALQAALDHAGFSPGVIDGNTGRKTEIALRAYQTFASLPVTGKIDDATRKSLGIDTRPGTRTYLITADDQKLIAPPPKTWPEKAKVPLLGYQSLQNLVAERGHCSIALLSRLNPKVDLKNLKPGQALTIPNVDDTAPSGKAISLDVDLGGKMIRVVGAGNKIIGLYHCSIAADRKKRPSGRCSVVTIVDNPRYRFDPVSWPEVKNVKEKLDIPSGPRSPVGICWIGLSIDGYGIHGTPEPENIGKTGSHGCFRLTNWDAMRLSRMVDVGTEVRFSDEPTPSLANSVKTPVTKVKTPKGGGKTGVTKTSIRG